MLFLTIKTCLHWTIFTFLLNVYIFIATMVDAGVLEKLYIYL